MTSDWLHGLQPALIMIKKRSPGSNGRRSCAAKILYGDSFRIPDGRNLLRMHANTIGDDEEKNEEEEFQFDSFI